MTARYDVEKDAFWYNDTIRALARHLSPAIFRFGGTNEDFTRYSFQWNEDTAAEVSAGGSSSSSTTSSVPWIPNKQVMNTSMFQAILNFTKSVSFDFVFGVNAVTDREIHGTTNRWNATNFEALLNSVELALTEEDVFGWELSNEMDLKCVDVAGTVLFDCHRPPSNVSGKPVPYVTAQQLAKDFGSFRQVLLRRFPSPASPQIWGPDIAGSITTYGRDFVGNLTFDIDAFTWHFYYGPGSSRPGSLSEANFSQPDILDRFVKDGLQALEVFRNDSQKKQKVASVVVGETSSTYGGGTSNVSASFVAGFMWLDKLSVAANLEEASVCRQTFAHSAYAMVGTDNKPNPNYWTSILWKRLIGRYVLHVDGWSAYDRTVRTYAFCKRAESDAVVVVYLNTLTTNVTLDFSLFGGALRRHDLDLESFVLTSSPGVLSSRDILLNGRLLRLADSQTATLPSLKGRELDDTEEAVVPPKSYGFFVARWRGTSNMRSSTAVRRDDVNQIEQDTHHAAATALLPCGSAWNADGGSL
eukprot:g1002.t1